MLLEEKTSNIKLPVSVVQTIPETQKELSDLLFYQEGVKLLAETNSEDIHYNSGAKHAMIVMDHIIKSAKNVINIFAGNFDDRVCSDAPSKYYKSLQSYILKGGKINVILNNLTDISKYNKTLDLLKQFSASDKYSDNIKVYITDDKLYSPEGEEYHITTADDKMFRKEYDIKRFAAKFSFNRPSDVLELNDEFNRVLENSTRLNLKNLPY